MNLVAGASGVNMTTADLEAPLNVLLQVDRENRRRAAAIFDESAHTIA